MSLRTRRPAALSGSRAAKLSAPMRLMRSVSPALKRRTSASSLGTTRKTISSRYGSRRPALVRLPVMRVALEDDPLAGHVRLQAEGAEAGHLRGRGGEAPRLGQPSLGLRGTEQVPGQDGDAVEHPLRDRGRLRHLDRDAPRVELARDDRPAADQEHVALRRAVLLVEVALEAEHDVVGGHGVSVREAEATPQLQLVAPPVRRRLPRLREGGRGAVAGAVDADQVAGHAADDVARRAVHHRHRVQRLRAPRAARTRDGHPPGRARPP